MDRRRLALAAATLLTTSLGAYAASSGAEPDTSGGMVSSAVSVDLPPTGGSSGGLTSHLL